MSLHPPRCVCFQDAVRIAGGRRFIWLIIRAAKRALVLYIQYCCVGGAVSHILRAGGDGFPLVRSGLIYIQNRTTPTTRRHILEFFSDQFIQVFLMTLFKQGNTTRFVSLVVGGWCPTEPSTSMRLPNMGVQWAPSSRYVHGKANFTAACLKSASSASSTGYQERMSQHHPRRPCMRRPLYWSKSWSVESNEME